MGGDGFGLTEIDDLRRIYGQCGCHEAVAEGGEQARPAWSRSAGSEEAGAWASPQPP